jgi:hypothetical protein
MEKMGGKLVMDGLKVDGDPSDAEDETVDRVKSIVAMLG